MSIEALAFIQRHTTSLAPLSFAALKTMLEDQFKINVADKLLHNIRDTFRKDMGYGTDLEAASLLDWLGKEGATRAYTDDEGRLTRMVFMSEWVQKVWGMDLCHEILQIDATHKTNRWGFFFIPITGVDVMGKNISLGSIALRQEGEADYVWALEQIKAITGKANVRTVFTDGLFAYKAVIRRCFPGAKHLRCWWHIQRSLRRRLRSTLGQHYNDFWDEISRMHHLHDEAEVITHHSHKCHQCRKKFHFHTSRIATRGLCALVFGGQRRAPDRAHTPVGAKCRQRRKCFCCNLQISDRGITR